MAISPIRPVAINPTPSMVVLMLGGAAGALLMLSICYAAPLGGWPALDVLRGIGALLTSEPGTALALGAVVFLGLSVPLLPLIALLTWTVMPGPVDTIRGALANGAVIGAACWTLVGLLLGLTAAVGQVAGTEMPGLAGIGGGIPGVVLFAGGALAYGLGVALVGLMEQGISPMDALGWEGYTHAATGPMELSAHRSSQPPAPSAGERPWRRPA